MTIKDRLMADFKEAMKTKDEIAKNTISFARAALNSTLAFPEQRGT